MDIIITGNSKREYMPDETEIKFTFNQKSKSYEEVLDAGTKSVEEYLNFLLGLGYKKEDFRTENMRVSEDKEYNGTTKKYETIGFVFSQTINLRFDYDIKKLANLMEMTSKLDNAPLYTVSFDVKNKDKIKYELYTDAVTDAKNQAEILARASGMKLVCPVSVSTDLNMINYECYSETRFDGARLCKTSASNSIQNTFTPENVVVESSLKVIWRAE